MFINVIVPDIRNFTTFSYTKILDSICLLSRQGAMRIWRKDYTPGLEQDTFQIHHEGCEDFFIL